MSITIIDHTKPPAPILEWKPKPTFRTNYERDSYWAKEKVKWIEGVGDIPGTLYHKTQEQKIKNRNTGVIFRPTCRDVDLLIHQTIRDCRKNGEADAIIKGRGIGLSVEMGCLANYFMKVYLGTTSFLTSQEKAKIASMFSKNVALTYDQYDDDIKPVQVNRRETVSDCYLKTEQLFIDENGQEQLNTSQIICRETSDSPKSASAFSGEGAIFGAYDEFFLHKRRRELIRSSTSCYVDQSTGITTGFLFLGGTCEDTLTNSELSDLSLMVKEIQDKGKLETMNCRLTFIPAWMGKFMVNGWSDQKKAMEWWNKQIEELEKLKDGKALRAFRMNNPMHLDDIFELTSGARFEDDVSLMIKEQHKFLILNPPPIKTCNLVDLGGNVIQNLDKEGKTRILEEPRPNVEYHLCIDGVGTGTEHGEEEGSSVAGTVVKMFDNNGLVYAPVAIYKERPKTIEESYFKLVSLLKYYNKMGGFKCISAEGNQGTTDHFAVFLIKQGLEKYIMARKDLSGKGHSNTKKSFQFRTTEVKIFQMRSANMFLRKNISNIRFTSLLEDMLTPMTENTDELDSWLQWFVSAVDYDKPAPKPRPIIEKEIPKIGVDAQGRTTVTWVKV